MSSSPRKSAVTDFMSTCVLYGGMVATRAQVYADLESSCGPNGERLSWLMVDRLVHGCRELSPEEIQAYRQSGMIFDPKTGEPVSFAARKSRKVTT